MHWKVASPIFLFHIIVRDGIIADITSCQSWQDQTNRHCYHHIMEHIFVPLGQY